LVSKKTKGGREKKRKEEGEKKPDESGMAG